MSLFSDFLKNNRKRIGMTQAELGKRLGVSKQVVSNLERGYTTSVSPDLLSDLAEIFDVSLDYILGISEFKNNGKENLDKDEQEFLQYYSKLSRTDQRWIVGQMIDLIKRSEDTEDVPQAK